MAFFISQEIGIDNRQWMCLVLRLPENFPQKYENTIRRTVELCAVKRHLNESIRSVVQIVRG